MLAIRSRLTGIGLETETSRLWNNSLLRDYAWGIHGPIRRRCRNFPKVQVNLARVGLNNGEDASKSNESQLSR